MSLKRMKNSGDNFFCDSCNKEVIDFRNQDKKAIKTLLKNPVCGVFTNDQLPGQKKMQGFQKVFFYVFVILSFIGFNTKPLAAQADKKSDSIAIKKETTEKKHSHVEKNRVVKRNEKANRKKRKKIFRKRRKQPITIGCPSF